MGCHCLLRRYVLGISILKISPVVFVFVRTYMLCRNKLYDASLNLPVFLEDSICLCLPGTILVIKGLHFTDLALSILEPAEPICHSLGDLIPLENEGE